MPILLIIVISLLLTPLHVTAQATDGSDLTPEPSAAPVLIKINDTDFSLAALPRLSPGTSLTFHGTSAAQGMVTLQGPSGTSEVFTTMTKQSGEWEIAYDTTGLTIGRYEFSLQIPGSDAVAIKLTIGNPDSYPRLTSVPETHLNSGARLTGFSLMVLGAVLSGSAMILWFTRLRHADSPTTSEGTDSLTQPRPQQTV